MRHRRKSFFWCFFVPLVFLIMFTFMVLNSSYTITLTYNEQVGAEEIKTWTDNLWEWTRKSAELVKTFL